MYRLKKKALLMLLPAVSLLPGGCIHDDFAESLPDDIPVGNVITIAQLRELYQAGPHEFTSDYSVYATVTMDDKKGNIYRSAFVEDGTAAINLCLQAPGGIYQGDSVRIYLKGTTLGSYQQMLQLDNVNADRNIIKLATQKTVAASPMRISDITPQHQGRLLKLAEVQFADAHTGLPFADAENLQPQNRRLEDCDGNSIIVRTSGYASFAGQPVPGGNGNLVAIVSQHMNQMQLYIRHLDEVELDGERCAIPGDDHELITLAQLRQNYREGVARIPDNTRIEGVVISDREHSNHPGQNLFMMDESGQGMVVRFGSFHDFPLGTHIRVLVSGLRVSDYQGLLQIDNTPIAQAHNLGTADLPAPREVSVREIRDNIDTYQSTLVRISGAIISGGNTFAGTLTITDNTGSMPMYTHNWASFAGNALPTGVLTLTGIASYHFEPQLMIRSLNDIIIE